MSVIERMSILGIRAFGPRDEDQQVIHFQHPLTLLVGPNGAGKTTIIECLKYATTGEHPLNTKGGAFVHDPKLAHENEVRAKVRLQCRNLKGHKIVVERGLQATQKAKNIQFKTMDGVITKERNGETASITSKCAELNREMVATLGVSKAVLDNVIFCHQEESNWPLSEGKTVKQKFDDIFAATRYIKALEEIRKVQKSQKSEMTKENVAMEFLESNSKKAASLEHDVESTQRKLEASKQSTESVREQMVPIDKRRTELDKKHSSIVKMDGELGALKSRREQMLEDEEKLKNRIRNIFSGSDQQLKDLQNEQGQALRAKQKKQRDCEKQIAPLEGEIKIAIEEKMTHSITRGQLQQEIDTAENTRRLHNKDMVKLNSSLKLNLSGLHSGDEIGDDKVKEFASVLKDKVELEAQNYRSHKVRLEQEMRNAEDELRQAWQEKTELSEGCKHKTNAMVELKQKHAKNQRDLSRLQVASDNDQLDVLQTKLDTVKEELAMTEMSCHVDEMRNDEKNFKIKKSQLQRQLEAVEGEITDLQKSSETRTRIDMTKKDLRIKEETVKRLEKKHLPVFQELGIPVPPEKSKLSSWIIRKENEIRGVQQSLDAERRKVTQLSTKREMLTREIQEKRRKQEELDGVLFALCGSNDLESDLAKLEVEIQDLQGNKGLTDGIQFMYKKFIKELKADGHDQSDVPCPLCQRLFEETSEIDELVSSLQRKLELAPRKLESQMRELKSKKDRYKTLLNAKPKKTELDRLAREIPALRHSATDLDKQIAEVTKAHDETDERLEALRSDECKAKDCVADVSQAENAKIEMRDLERQIRQLESRLPVTSSRSLDDVTAEKKKLSSEINAVNQEIDTKRREIDNQLSAVNGLKEKLNTIQAEKLKLASDLQKCEQLKEQQKALSGDIARVKAEVEEAKRQLQPLQKKVEELESRKKKATRHNDERLSALNRDLHELQAKQNDFEDRRKTIEDFEASGTERRLKRTTEKIEELESGIVTKQERVGKLRGDISRLQQEITTCTDRQRDLEDNAALRERRHDIEQVNGDVTAKEKALDGMDASKLNSEYRELLKQKQSLQTRLDSANARQEVFKEELKKTRRELLKDEYKFADERYKQCLINSTTLELASGDLGKYYKALDRAIMRFHQIKMDEINKIIRDLWQKTYKGKDIDYIQIRSSEDTGGSTSTRRVFNYRVVMRCGDAEMDMRGRCSAGQKVLASLVIRLALAETFCINCGILALDEPTTNLDRDNIESLAQALVSIIESRQRQRNFQMLVITHDEDFVDLLGRSSYVDYYLSITKDQEGKSRVVKTPIRFIEH